jgi:hypothetical protein
MSALGRLRFHLRRLQWRILSVPHGGDAVSNRKSGSKAAAKRRERA